MRPYWFIEIQLFVASLAGLFEQVLFLEAVLRLESLNVLKTTVQPHIRDKFLQRLRLRLVIDQIR